MTDRLVARIWNEDGVEMPSLYERDGELICTWNYLLIVAPQFAFALKEIRRQPKGHDSAEVCDSRGDLKDVLAVYQQCGLGDELQQALDAILEEREPRESGTVSSLCRCSPGITQIECPEHGGAL